jgi:ubiquinone/menaquinone biosynthesis C-methylase UbiE
VSDRLESLGRRFARFTTDAVVARPVLWRLFRRPMRAQFERLAPVWDRRRGPESLIPLGAALDRLESPPRRILDVGTGTGAAARILARRFPKAEVVGVDLSPAMIEEARRLVPSDLVGRIAFEAGDASALPFADAAFDLVVLLNMIPFFEEVARLTTPGGTAVFASSSGPETPIYVAPETLRDRLEALGFARFEQITAGDGSAVIAYRTTQVAA